MEELLALLTDVVPTVDFEGTKNLVEQGLIDSLDIVEIIDRIESEYGFTIKPDDIDPDNFESAEALWEMIQKYID